MTTKRWAFAALAARANASTHSRSTARKRSCEPAWRRVVPRQHSATSQLAPLSCASRCSNCTMRLPSRGSSPPSARRETASTRLMSGAPSSASSAQPPTSPLAPASNATFPSASPIGTPLSAQQRRARRERGPGPRAAWRCYHFLLRIMRWRRGLPVRGLKLSLMVAAAVLAPAAALAVTDADRVAVYREFRTAFDAHRYPDALPLAEKLVALTEEQYGAADRELVTPLSNLGTTQLR